MPKTRELTPDLGAEIVTKFKAGISAAKIAKLYTISRRNVHYLEKRSIQLALKKIRKDLAENLCWTKDNAGTY